MYKTEKFLKRVVEDENFVFFEKQRRFLAKIANSLYEFLANVIHLYLREKT